MHTTEHVEVSDNSVMVHDGENGFLFNPYDIEDMVNAFEKLIYTSIDDKIKMQRKSRDIAQKLFNKDSFVQSYVKLIES